MDRANRDDLLRHGAHGPAERGKVRLLRSFDPSAPPDADVPDPYYGGPRGFDDVFDICERPAAGCSSTCAARTEPDGWTRADGRASLAAALEAAVGAWSRARAR